MTSMTAAELLDSVPIHRRGSGGYVVLAEIAQPWRDQFAAALRGSAAPLIDGAGPCAWAHDWQQWVVGTWHQRPGPFTPVLVIDLEATCDEGEGLPTTDMEIIEVGAVWATVEGTVLDTFQALVRPVVRPQLTPFCRQLTNIQQADVDSAELFPAVAARLASFARLHQIEGATWGSWGQYDAKQLVRDSARHGIASPLASFEHINLKRQFAKARRIKEVGMARALQMVGLPLDGAHHRGLDDACNIAKLLPFSVGSNNI